MSRSSFLIISTVLVVVLSLVAYVMALGYYIDDSILQNVDEIADHDVASIDAYLEREWEGLNGVVEEIKIEQIMASSDLSEYFEEERSSIDFEGLLLVDKSGNIYSNNKMINNKDKLYISEFVKTEDNKFVFYYKFNGPSVEQRSLIFGRKVSNLKIDNIPIEWIIGYTSPNNLAKIMKMFVFYKY